MTASGERVVEGRAEGLLEAGDRVTWSGRHFGFRWRLTVKVTALEPPRWFQDRMVSGPFASFTHDHFFEPSERGTRMHDVLAFRAPLRHLGRVADVVLLRGHVRRMLETRCDAIRAAAETS